MVPKVENYTLCINRQTIFRNIKIRNSDSYITYVSSYKIIYENVGSSEILTKLSKLAQQIDIS